MFLSETIFFILPLLLAGLIHHLVIIKFNLLPALAQPIDRKLTIGGKRLLGDAKTWRGFFVMVTATGLWMWLLSLGINIATYYHPLIAGAILGFGYSLGELPNSFAKRRLNILESARAGGWQGGLFDFFDQVDSVIGALLFLPLIYHPSVKLVIIIFFIGAIFHLIIDSYLHQRGYKKYLQ